MAWKVGVLSLIGGGTYCCQGRASLPYSARRTTRRTGGVVVGSVRSRWLGVGSRRVNVDSNEALRGWLLKASELESKIDRIAHKVEAGMSLADAWRECEALFEGGKHATRSAGTAAR